MDRAGQSALGRWPQDADRPEGRLGPIERFGDYTSTRVAMLPRSEWTYPRHGLQREAQSFHEIGITGIRAEGIEVH